MPEGASRAHILSMSALRVGWSAAACQVRWAATFGASSRELPGLATTAP